MLIKSLHILLTMTDLIVCGSSNKAASAHISKVIAAETWDAIYVIIASQEHFILQTTFNSIIVDNQKTIREIKEQIVAQLKGKVKGLEVGVNIVAGTGKEHMALLMALMELGLSFRWVYATKDGITVA